jgi:hypothetical protein
MTEYLFDMILTMSLTLKSHPKENISQRRCFQSTGGSRMDKKNVPSTMKKLKIDLPGMGNGH